MSTTYNLEPQPTAKVLLQTTTGDILLELFAKQTPLTSRNFLQLCLDGYYDNTIFHRVIPGFIVQGGDPTGTGEGGCSIYDDGRPFADEFHSRLKFNRRGLVGMANGGGRDDNGSQFFVTLGKTEELNGRNTLFGRVVGDTIYNVVRMGEAELEGERPLFPTRIVGTEILVNPFEDMIRRERIAKRTVEEDKKKVAIRKKVGKKTGKVLLSFGGDDEGDQVDAVPVTKKPKFNTKLVTAVAEEPAPNGTSTHAPRNPEAPRKAPKATKQPTPEPVTKPAQPPRKRPSPSPSPSPPPDVTRVTSLAERTNAQIAELKASMKRTVSIPNTAPARKKSALEQLIPERSIRGRKRKHGGGGGGDGLGSGGGASKDLDREALEILNSFRAKLDSAPVERRSPARGNDVGTAMDSKRPEGAEDDVTAAAAAANEEDDDDKDVCDLHFISNCQSCQSWDKQEQRRTTITTTISNKNNNNRPDQGDADGGEEHDNDNDNDLGWMSHALSFDKDRLGKDLTWRRKNEEELVVIDPREKGREIQEGARKARREGREGREWDRRR